MTDGHKAEQMQFLTVAEAADRLGVSRLRLREAAVRGKIPSRRDNEGRLRLDLTDAPKVENDANALPPDALVDLLFDEVEELQGDLGRRDDDIAALTDLADRQNDALDRADAALDAKADAEARLTALLDRAMDHLEADADARERLEGVAGRALTALDSTGDRLEQSLHQNARFEALVERALQMAEAAEGTDNPAALTRAADRAMALLDEALGRVETEQARGAGTEALLDRALAAGEQAQRDLAAKSAEVEKQQGTVEAALAVSERAVAVAGQKTQPPARKKGFFRRLLGI